jgi:integrase
MVLNKRAIAALKPPARGNKVYYADAPKGFGVRVTAAGARAFVLNYRIDGRERRTTIGSCDSWSLEAARDEARALLRGVDKGVDPLAKAERADEALFKARAEAFLAHGRRKKGLPLRPATKREYTRALMTYAAELHARPLAEVRRGEVATVIQRVAGERGEVTAQRTRAALSRLWTWAIANGHAEVNPVSGTEGYETPARDRRLADAELAAIWAATADRSDFAAIVRLCLWTGCRRGEAGGMAWSELDGGTWTVPGSRTKNGRALVLPLPRQALAALEGRHRLVGRDLVFGRGPHGFQAWSKAKERLDRRLGFAKGWDLHDLRRAVETRMAALGVPKEHVNKILNHAAGPVTKHYDLHSYLPEKAAALQLWADELDRVAGMTLGVQQLREKVA